MSVFAGLDQREKSSFFALLDDYFNSRPHLMQQGITAQQVSNAAFANPRATSAILKGANAPPIMQQAFSRMTSSNPAPGAPAPSSAPPPAAPKPSKFAASGLTSGKSIGGLSTASKSAAFKSMMPSYESPQSKQAAQAEADRNTKFPTYVNNSISSSSSSSLPPPPTRRTAAPAAPTMSGPTVVALYDYQSDDANDLSFVEGTVIELTEKVSEDWLKGRLNGMEGIFPSTYVQEQ